MDGKILVDDLDADGLQRLIHYAKKKRKLLLGNSEVAPSAPTTEDVNLETDEDELRNEDQKKEEFLIPKKQRKRRFTQLSIIPPSVENGNRFSILNEETQNMEESQDLPSPEEGEPATGTQDNNSTTIVLRDKSLWLKISKTLNAEKINYTKATTTRDGIRIQPQTISDFKNVLKLFKDENVPFHTHQLKTEKNLRIVIKGIPTEIKEDDIYTDLLEKGYPALKITRMNGKNNNPAPMALVEIKKDYKSLYKVPTVNGLSVQIEPLKNRRQIPQCHRCQLFGHIQKNCNANFACMKCAGEHSTHLCTKEKTTPAKCVNCGGAHTSIFKKCRKNPNSLNYEHPGPSVSKESPTMTTKTNPWTKNVKLSENSKTEKIVNELSKMLLEYRATNPSQEQKTKFFNHIDIILHLL